MKKKQSPRRFETGRSLYRYHGEWFEEKVIEAIVTDTHIGVDIDSQGEDGNKETPWAQGSSATPVRTQMACCASSFPKACDSLGCRAPRSSGCRRCSTIGLGRS